MGVKLSSLVEKKRLTFEDLVKRRIAVDFSNSAYQFLSSIRQPDGTPLMDTKGRVTSHLVGIWSRFTNLIQKDIKLIMVLDGIPPEQKGRETSRRSERKSEAKEKFEQAQEEGDEEMMSRYAKQFTILTQEMVAEAKELMEAMGLPVLQAPSEADAQMAYLNKQGDVWACASSDYDSLIHGAPRMVTNLTLSQRRKLPSGVTVKTYPEMIELNDLLKMNGITQDQLMYIAILTGTDYNPNGVHGIGPKKALKLVKEKKNPQEIFQSVECDFDWKEILDVFKKMPVQKKYSLTWKECNEERVKKILVDDHDFAEERVDAVLQKLGKKSQEREQKGLSGWV